MIEAFTPLGVLSEYSWMRSGCRAGQRLAIGNAERSAMSCSLDGSLQGAVATARWQVDAVFPPRAQSCRDRTRGKTDGPGHPHADCRFRGFPFVVCNKPLPEEPSMPGRRLVEPDILAGTRGDRLSPPSTEQEQAMSYIDGFVIAVPTANKQKFIDHATTGDPDFLECGATRVL